MKCVLVNGFGWSGSGALIDELSSYEGFFGLRNDFDEASIFKGKYSLAWVSKRISSGNCTFSKKEVLNFIFYMAGQKRYFDGAVRPADRMNIKRNELLQWGVGKNFLLSRVFDLAESLFDETEDGNSFLSQSDQFVTNAQNYFLDLCTERSRRLGLSQEATVISNNDPSGYNVDLFKLVPNSRAFIVTRNLFDVYANLILRGKFENSERGCAKFVRDQLNKTSKFYECLRDAEPGVRESMWVVPFEAYVLDGDVREGVRQCAGAHKKESTGSFDPEKSKVKIGLFQTMFDRGELEGVDEGALQEAEGKRVQTMRLAADLLGPGRIVGQSYLDRHTCLLERGM